MDDIFTDDAARGALINEVAARRGLAPVVVEKDLWVCWTLARLHAVDGLPKMTFKGGTSLSKVHGLIYRFSEDLDLTFSRDGWGFDGDRDPLNLSLSKKKRAALVEEVGKKAASIVDQHVVPGLRSEAKAALGGSGWTVELDPSDSDHQTVNFRYPSTLGDHGYLPPVIKMEFGARGDPWPTALREVRPYLEEEFSGEAKTAVASVDTLLAQRTFWEKATLLHGLHHQTLSNPEKATLRLSRHAYDLYQMWTPLKAELLAEQALLRSVVQNKECFFASNPAKYDLVLKGTLNSTPHAALEERLRKDLVDMKDMFFPNRPVPTFDTIKAALQEIDSAVAAMDWNSPPTQS